MALEKQGANARIAVLRYGGHILPVVDDEAANLVVTQTAGKTAAHHLGSKSVGAAAPMPGQVPPRPEPPGKGRSPDPSNSSDSKTKRRAD